jgi:uncharacterized protein
LCKELGIPVGTRVPGLDEDESTLAVAAARALVGLRKLAPDAIKGVEFVGPTAPAWAPTAALALGATARMTTFTEAPAAAPADGTMRISALAPRPGSPELGRNEAFARAEFPGPGRTLDATPKHSRTVSRASFDKLVAWETKALLQVPMGAYIPKASWEATLPARYQLLAGFCANCKRGYHPRLDPCPVCGGTTQSRSLPTVGHLYTYTAIAAGGGPSEFDPLQDVEGTYGVGIVDFGDAIRIAGILAETDLAQVAIGDKMEAVFRRIYAQEGAWRYGTKFRRAEGGH